MRALLAIIWGLQGQSQIVGMGDTGLDVTHCLFKDDNVPFTGFQTEAGEDNFEGTSLRYFDSTTHRKIRSDIFQWISMIAFEGRHLAQNLGDRCVQLQNNL